MPVVANGDITSPEKARDVLAYTGADAVMVGRAAQGRPWIFREIGHFLATGEHLPPPLVSGAAQPAAGAFARPLQPVWRADRRAQCAQAHCMVFACFAGWGRLRQRINTIDDCQVQWQAVADYLEQLGQQMERLPQPSVAATEQEIEEWLHEHPSK